MATAAWTRRYLTSTVSLVSMMTVGGLVLGQTGVYAEPPALDEAAAESGGPELVEGYESGALAHEHESEPRLALGLDVVAGFGKTPAEARDGEIASARIVSESLVIAAGYEIAERIELFLHVPIVLGSVHPRDMDSRSNITLGNVEIEGEYVLPLASATRLVFALGFTAPTARGREVPESLTEAIESGELPSRASLDRGALLRAAASARGFEDESWFEVDRFGVIPKARLDTRYGWLLLRPYLQLENLFDTGNESRAASIELLAGTYLGVAVAKHFELGARVWGDFLLAGVGETVGVVEPRVSAQLGHFNLTVGGVFPFAHDRDYPLFVGIRGMLTARF